MLNSMFVVKWYFVRCFIISMLQFMYDIDSCNLCHETFASHLTLLLVQCIIEVVFVKKKNHRLKKIKLTHSNQIKMIKIYTIYILFSGIWFVTFGHLLCWWSRSKNWRGHMPPLYNKRHQKFIIRLKTLVFNFDVFGAELNSSFEICLNFWK